MTAFALTVIAALSFPQAASGPEFLAGGGHHHHRHHHRPRRRRPRMLGPVIASWYYDAGSTACGFHATYGIASRTLPCGTRVQLEHNGHTVIATVDDRGPYVYSRTFDQDPATKAADDCSDLCDVDYRVLP